MMELVDISGISTQFRICRMRTANSKKVEGTLNSPFCAPKLGVPTIWVGDLFCMRGGPIRKICDPQNGVKITTMLPNWFFESNRMIRE